MINDAKEDKFDLIITKEVSRFSRNLSDSIKYTQILMQNDVGVYFQTNGINTYDPNSEFILNMMGSVAQEEVKRLSSRVKWGHKEAIKKGRVLGSNNIIGYTKNNATLVIEPNEADKIREIFKLYATGKYGFTKLFSLMEQMIMIIGYLCTGKLSLSSLSGPIGIYKIVGASAKSGLINLIYLTGYLCVNVGIINIIPLPAFDGGRILFLIIEKIKGKPVSPKVENTIHSIGMVLLMILMVAITINDIIKLFQ